MIGTFSAVALVWAIRAPPPSSAIADCGQKDPSERFHETSRVGCQVEREKYTEIAGYFNDSQREGTTGGFCRMSRIRWISSSSKIRLGAITDTAEVAPA